MCAARGPTEIAGGAQGHVPLASLALLALLGLDEPTPEQVAGARLLALGLADLHYLARSPR